MFRHDLLKLSDSLVVWINTPRQTTMRATSTFPIAFQCYKPVGDRVYGAVCMSPNNNILLVKGRRTLKWSFPKGHRMGSESYLECAQRETMEETGVDIVGLIPVAYQKLSHGEYYFFEMDLEIVPEVQDTREVMEAKWVSVADMQCMSCNVDVNKFLINLRRKACRPYHPTDQLHP